MKLAHRLILALTATTTAGIVVGGVTWVTRETALIEGDAQNDLSTIGRSLRPALHSTWHHEGRDRALELLEFASERIRKRVRDVDISWLELDSPASAQWSLTPTEVARLRSGREIVRRDGDELSVFVPVRSEGLPAGALNLVQSLDRERAFVAESVRHVAIGTAVLVIVLGAISFAFVTGFVDRPLRALAAQARAVASGNLTVRVEAGTDELGLVAREMNGMCDRLLEARAGILAEHAARLSTLQQLRHSDRLSTVGQLAAGIAHELGTPLNVALGRAQMIASGEQTGDAARACATIITERVKVMTRIIRQLLDFARRPAGVKVVVDLADIARHVMDLMAPLAERRLIKLEVDAEPGRHLASGEPAELEQVVTNIVANAIDASCPGGTIVATVQTREARPPEGVPAAHGAYVQVEIRDDGSGIADTDVPQVFDPFFTTKPIGAGTGLGLSVAYGIIRDHGGWIDVESQLGTGSRFVVNLPGVGP